MKEIKSIDFILENCEVINVPIDNIWKFTVGKSYLKKEVYNKKLYKTHIVNDLFCIIVNDNAVRNLCNWSDFPEKPIDRLLAYNDITQIHINYDDKNDAKDVFYIEWWGNDPYNNEGQKTWQLNNKLMIRIADPENLKNENEKIKVIRREITD